MSDWTFFSNYGHVLVCLSRNNEVRLRDVAAEVGITERAVQKIVKDMQDAGFITISKHGRCNRYRLNKRKSLRHHLESHCNVGKLLALVTRPDSFKAAANKTDNIDSPPLQPAVRTEPPTAANIRQAGSVPELTQALPPQDLKVQKTAKKKNKLLAGQKQGSLF